MFHAALCIVVRLALMPPGPLELNAPKVEDHHRTSDLLLPPHHIAKHVLSTSTESDGLRTDLDLAIDHVLN